MPLTTGDRLGPYELLSLLGSGGMGDVFRARDTRLDRIVAIKVLEAHVAADPDRRQRFEREARVISQLNHPHICVLFDVGREADVDFLVMEYLEGHTLAAQLDQGAVSIDQALRYSIEIADGLDAAHRQGIVHRDLKPANVMLTKAGAKLLDFGIASSRTADGPPRTRKGSASETHRGATMPRPSQSGTLPARCSTAPDSWKGEADARSDLFAFSAVLARWWPAARSRVSQASLIAAILGTIRRSPRCNRYPAALDRSLKCLEGSGHAARPRDLVDELKWIAEGMRTPSVAPAPLHRRRDHGGWSRRRGAGGPRRLGARPPSPTPELPVTDRGERAPDC